MSERFAAALERLSRVVGVQGALIVETEAGVPVASELSTGVDGGAVAALSASLYRRATRAAAAGGMEAVNALQLEADGGHVIVAGAGDLLVIAVTGRDAQLGLVRVEAQRTAESLL